MVRAVIEPEDRSWESLPRSGIVRYEEGGRPRTAQFGTVFAARPGQPARKIRDQDFELGRHALKVGSVSGLGEPKLAATDRCGLHSARGV